ncbi:hypothetical protein [Streptomyces sp. NBC_00259]|uniref:hypothetical protein n=1 Tax=Streptomyces sp. NBC_00259 TaxID=2903643 RepID=UPI002E2B9B58|nr:hypothetical protein [Streptomyces sp. NBC_00259]
MRQQPLKPAPQLSGALVSALVTMAAWAAWLGWDQHRDVQPDGTTTGPYEAWQVIGLVLTLLAPVYWGASRHSSAVAVFGTTAGLTLAAFYDWSDDSSGLFVVGVGTVTVGSLLLTAVAAALITAVGRDEREGLREGGGPSGGPR